MEKSTLSGMLIPNNSASLEHRLTLSSNLGELTDKGRRSTLALGQRLRHLYVDQLGFMPKLIGDADLIYLRATPMPRALESMQQAFCGMYPASARSMDFPAPTMIIRNPAEETLYPNDQNCRRFSQLSRAFAQRTADRCKFVEFPRDCVAPGYQKLRLFH